MAAGLRGRSMRPTAKQYDVIAAVVGRILLEADEEQRDVKRGNTSGNPLCDMVHGVPGCGKSEVMRWLREAFEDVLGWKHGIQFVFLAFQNLTAAQLGGDTIHHWSGIPVAETEGTTGTRDTQTLSTKCKCLRFILLDEISMCSAPLLGQLEVVVAKVVRKKSVYRVDAAGKARPFGGINFIALGDWLQLKPVAGMALFDSPSDAKFADSVHWQHARLGKHP